MSNERPPLLTRVIAQPVSLPLPPGSEPDEEPGFDMWYQPQYLSRESLTWEPHGEPLRAMVAAIERARGLSIGVYQPGVVDEARLVWCSWMS